MGRKTHLKWSWPSVIEVRAVKSYQSFSSKKAVGGGGDDGTGQDSVLFADIIYKIFISFKLKIHRGFPKVISSYDNN